MLSINQIYADVYRKYGLISIIVIVINIMIIDHVIDNILM